MMCFFFQAEDGIRDYKVTGVQTCALPIFAELCAVGKPSVLVPLPIETVRQRDNAMAMQEAGAAEMILDNEIIEKLYPTLRHLLSTPEQLQMMRERARSMAILDADEKIARHILKLAEGG